MNRLLLTLFAYLLANCAFSQSLASDQLYAEGVELYRQKQFAQAINCFEQAVAFDEMEIPVESPRRYYSVSWLARCYYMLGNEPAAMEISPYDYMFEPVDRRLTVESDNEDILAHEAFSIGDLDLAISHIMKCLELEKTNLGELSIHCIGSHYFLGELYTYKREENTAIKYYTKGLDILAKLNIDYSVYNFNLHTGLTNAYLQLGDIDMAKKEAGQLKLLADYERIKTDNMYPTAMVESLLARIDIQDKNRLKAAEHIETAFRILIDGYAPGDENVILSLENCISILTMSNQYDLCVSLIKEAIESFEAKGALKSHMGLLYAHLGEFTQNPEESIKTCNHALAFLKDTDEPYRGWYYSTICTIAYSYHELGDYLKAIDLYKVVCDFYEKNDITAGVYRRALMSLADIYDELGDTENAYISYNQILDILKNDKNDPDYILTYIRWVPVYAKYSMDKREFGYNTGYDLGQGLSEVLANIKIGEFLNRGIGLEPIVNALMPLYRTFLSYGTIGMNVPWSAIDHQLTQLTYDYLVPELSYKHPTTWSALSLLAHVKYLCGNFKEAISLMNKIIDGCKNVGAPYDNYLHDLAYYQYDSGDTEGAFENFLVGYNFNKNIILSKYRWMTLDERTKYTNARRGNLDNIPHYAAITPDDLRYSELGYNALLFTKGLLLNSTIELSRLLQEEGDEATLTLLNQWRETNRQYQLAVEHGDAAASDLKLQADVLERQLMAVSDTYGNYTDGLAVEYPDVQNGLDYNDLAIEFFSYQKDARSRMYGALIIGKTGKPKYISVGCDSDWNGFIDTAYKSTDLFNSLFVHLFPYLPSKENGSIYFAADGILHTIAIENLCGAEKYTFKRLSSTRELAINRDMYEGIGDVVVYGGIKYGLGELEELYESSKSDNRHSMEFLEKLPGTKIEADVVCRLFAGKVNVDERTEQDASEESFKANSGKHVGIMHIATHGFFHQPVSSDIMSADDMAMLSSGLYFAGAQNTLWLEPVDEMKEDGILSAKEISQMDLRGLRLAVLSACETGKGSIGPEGVFGLQRGFKQAGAESIMMTLWKVDDIATQMLMEEFYKKLISGVSQYDALRAAQNKVKQDYPDPYYWAGFVLIDALNHIKI